MTSPTSPPPIAIVSMGCVFPDASSPEALLANIRENRDAARDVPDHRWVLPLPAAFAEAPATPDKVYSRRACLVEGFALDTDSIDIDPAEARALDTAVQMALSATRDALAGVNLAHTDLARAGVILGNIALPTESSSALTWWTHGRALRRAIARTGEDGVTLPPDTSAPPAAINRYVTGLPAAIVARAFGFGGAALTLDAACSSSLFALKLAVDALQEGVADVMVTGGLSRPDALYTQMGFSQLRALSPTGTCSPFDRDGDGLVVGEGAGALVLKRLEDAEAHGDKIYAVVRGVGLSNDTDGRLLAPDEEGQLRAMRAAYSDAGWTPAGVDMVECHATGTPVGDRAEFGSLRALWGDDSGEKSCVIGSVKSNIGHLLTGAGAASLIKAALALDSATLLPTANFKAPSPDIGMERSPFEVLDAPRPWPRPADHPRRAAVSGFGFGGTNAHILLEAYEGKQNNIRPTATKPEEYSASIVGVGFHLGGGVDGREALTRALLEGAPGERRVTGFEVPYGAFRIPPTELVEALPQQTLMLQVASRALLDAKLELTEQDRLQTGVFVGIGLDLNTANYHLRWVLRRRAPSWARAMGKPAAGPDFERWVDALADAAGPALTANRTMGGLGSIVASRIAREFQIGGPAFAISSEECSGMSALEIAARAIRRGELRYALVGAIDLIGGDARAKLADALHHGLASQGSPMPFDVHADGLATGDGAVCLVLTRREPGLARVYAHVNGVGASTSRRDRATDPLPTGDGYALSVRRALDDGTIWGRPAGLFIFV